MKEPLRREIELIDETGKKYKGVLKIARDFCFNTLCYFILSDVIAGAPCNKDDREDFSCSLFLRNYYGEEVNFWDYNTIGDLLGVKDLSLRLKKIYHYEIRFKSNPINFKKISI